MTEPRPRPTLKELIERGEVQIINGKLYGLCQDCGCVVRIDKPLIGSLHICD